MLEKHVEVVVGHAVFTYYFLRRQTSCRFLFVFYLAPPSGRTSSLLVATITHKVHHSSCGFGIRRQRYRDREEETLRISCRPPRRHQETENRKQTSHLLLLLMSSWTRPQQSQALPYLDAPLGGASKRSRTEESM